MDLFFEASFVFGYFVRSSPHVDSFDLWGAASRLVRSPTTCYSRKLPISRDHMPASFYLIAHRSWAVAVCTVSTSPSAPPHTAHTNELKRPAHRRLKDLPISLDSWTVAHSPGNQMHSIRLDPNQPLISDWIIATSPLFLQTGLLLKSVCKTEVYFPPSQAKVPFSSTDPTFLTIETLNY